MANKLVPVVKKALANKYGFKNVSVKNGQGTAWGWVDARINIPEIQDNSQRRMIIDQAYSIAFKAVSDAGLKFYTYSDDMGGENNCLIIQIN